MSSSARLNIADYKSIIDGYADDRFDVAGNQTKINNLADLRPTRFITTKYTGDGNATKTIAHTFGVIPNLIYVMNAKGLMLISKNSDNAWNYNIAHYDTGGIATITAPTSFEFTVPSAYNTNATVYYAMLIY